MIFSKSKGQSSDSSSLKSQQRLTKLIILILLKHFHQLVWFSSLLWPLLLSPCWLLLFSPIFEFLFPIIVTQTLGLFCQIILPLVVLTLNLPSIHWMTLNLYFYATFFPELHAHISTCLLNGFIFMSNRHLKPNMAKIEISFHPNTHFSCSLSLS